MPQLQKVQYNTETGKFTYNYIGLVKQEFKGYDFRFTRKNIKDSSSRLAIIVTDSAGVEYIVNCSNPLSQFLKPKIASGELTSKQAIAILANKCWWVEGFNRDGQPRSFIAQPQGTPGEQMESISIDNLELDEDTAKKIQMSF